MTTHTGRIKRQHGKSVKSDLSALTWQEAKGVIIGAFGSISAVAGKLECHTNAIRGAVEGRCPIVLAALNEALSAK